MPFEPGHKKSNGRPPGSINKRTALIKPIVEALKEANHDPLLELLKDLPTLEGPMRAKINLELLDFLYPKKRAVEHSLTTEQSEILQRWEEFKTKPYKEIVDLTKQLLQSKLPNKS